MTSAQKRLNLVSRLAQRDGYRCAYCLKPLGRKHGRPATVDEVVPRCHGGRRNLSNAVLACGFCNHAKGCRLDWVPLRASPANL